jgi:hypothetical protein
LLEFGDRMDITNVASNHICHANTKMSKQTVWFADDLTVFARDNDELHNVLGLIREFRDAAGLVINTDKSEILELGNYKYSADIGIPLVKMAKITGVWFSEDYQLMSDTNWNHVRDNVFGKLAR